MLELVTESVKEGSDAEDYEDEFKEISTQINMLQKRIAAIRQSQQDNNALQDRLKDIQNIIDERNQHSDEYDDSIVRQMIECIKAYHNGHITIIFGGGYEVDEALIAEDPDE